MVHNHFLIHLRVEHSMYNILRTLFCQLVEERIVLELLHYEGTINCSLYLTNNLKGLIDLLLVVVVVHCDRTLHVLVLLQYLRGVQER